ncbi:MAG: hypothetical protein ABJK37_18690 [Paraglaciecola sp.]|uniref:hypothetical protein n=1 Tax=Paraglaciecola sp. TaxID=1920173 RepID=UPI0032968C84
MIKRSSNLIVFLLTLIAGMLILNTANAWSFDMFSFFSKDKATATIVHASLDSKLTELTSPPFDSNQTESQTTSAIKAKVQGDALITLTKSDGYIETAQAAFICESSSPVALVNDQKNARFDVWELDSMHSLSPLRKVPTNQLSTASNNWINYSVVDLACLPQQQLLVAVNYYDPRSKIALYLYDVVSKQFSLFSEAESNAQNLDKYFEKKDLKSGESILLYYSETKRKSAEIYHNYFNNIVLFSDHYPQGIEVLKLSIDDGNIEQWQVVDKKLLLHTIDNRNNKDPKTFYWSLDLSKVLIN